MTHSAGKHNLRIALDWMHDTYMDASILGSLLNPAQSDATKIVKWEKLSLALEQALNQGTTDEQQETAVVAQGLAKATVMLSGKYQWIITNVPYLKRGKQSEQLQKFSTKYYPTAKYDLATVFLERCLEFCADGGTSSIVLPQNWLFLTTYKKFCEKLLKNNLWHLIARLGAGAFETINGEVVKAILISISQSNTSKNTSQILTERKIDGILRGVDVSGLKTPTEKAERLLDVEIKGVGQAKQLENPDVRIALDDSAGILLEKYAVALNGMHGADSLRFRFVFWEVVDKTFWRYLQNTVDHTTFFSGRSQIFYWPNDVFFSSNSKARIQGMSGWGKAGVAISMMGNLSCTRYFGDAFDISCSPIIPHDASHLPAIWCFCSSPEYNEIVRFIDQALKVTNATLVKVPFDLDHWDKIAKERYPNGLPKPHSDNPTQWIFHGHPCGSVIWDNEKKWTVVGQLRIDDYVLQTVVARLLGFRWATETDLDMELSEESRYWVNKSKDLLPFADEDGIVCIPPVRGEMKAEDRLENLLAASYGEEWSSAKKAELLTQSNHAGKTLDTWLRDKFFIQHCKLFHNRPFIWHIWDGLRDGFAALVNYHKLDRKNLETLIYTYLGDWINRQKQDITNGIDGAQEKLSAAEALKKKLELILEGEDPYDIFVRWKPIEEQPIGWDPDLNDGVRLNIRPFMTVPDVGKKGAGVLRDKPNIKWGKDRGKDVESAPWYHLFKGNRINDYHLKLADKKAAREASKHE